MPNAAAKIDKHSLEDLYKQYNRLDTVNDPIRFAHQYKAPLDRELIGFISAIYAYGKVTQINAALTKIVDRLGYEPVRFLLETPAKELRFISQGIYHRFYTDYDLQGLLTVLRYIYSETGSIESACKKFIRPGDLQQTLSGLHEYLKKQLLAFALKETAGIRFMFPNAAAGSACKRTNLFLRWMIRKDNVDFGLWKCLQPSELVIPLDTHIARVALDLGFTERKTRDWKMAQSITNVLRKYDAMDPVRYDFALCHFSMDSRNIEPTVKR